VSREQQTSATAQSEASSRAQALEELVMQVAAPQARFAAQAVAGVPLLVAALAGPDPATAVPPLVSGPGALTTALPGDQVAVFGAQGDLLAVGGAAGPTLSSTLPEVQGALGGAASEAVDLLDSGTPVYDFAAPVRSVGGRVLGVVVYSMPLPSELMRLIGAVGAGYTPLLAANQPGAPLLTLSGSATAPQVRAAALPPALSDLLGGSAASLAGLTSAAGRMERAALEPMECSTSVSGSIPLTPHTRSR